MVDEMGQPRGRALLEAFLSLNVTLLNEGRTPTYTGGSGTIVDLNFITSSMARQWDWRVSDHYTHSDHHNQAIRVDVAGRSRATKQSHRGEKR